MSGSSPEIMFRGLITWFFWGAAVDADLQMDAISGVLISKPVSKITALKIGATSDKSSEVGPSVTAQHLAKVRDYIDTGGAEGAKVVDGGRRFKQD